MTKRDKQGDREDSWPGREDDLELCRETWDWRCWEAPGNTAVSWGCPKPPQGSPPSPLRLVFVRAGAELGAGVSPLPSHGEKLRSGLVHGDAPQDALVSLLGQHKPSARQDKGREGDVLPLHWQLPPCTQGCSAGPWDLPRYLQESP